MKQKGQEEELRHIISTVTPEVKKEWFAMPRFGYGYFNFVYFHTNYSLSSTGHLNLILGKLQYVDRPQFYYEGDLPPGAPVYYSDEDEDY